MKKVIKNKEYIKIDNIWYMLDKNGNNRKVVGKNILLELNDEVPLPSIGLGDTISKVTKFFGIKECDGCESRKEYLNKMFPWLSPNREFSLEERELLNRVLNNTTVENDDVNNIFKLYNEIFNSRLERCNCPGLFKQIVERLGALL